MSEKLPVSLIIPVYNMGEHIKVLWTLLKNGGITEIADEILFVNDGSSDSTKNFLDSISSEAKIVHLPVNQGRFKARFEGAKAARNENLLFLDARIRISSDFKEQIAYVCSRYQSAVADILIDENESVYSLYWKRSHDFIFRHHYNTLRMGPIKLTAENYDEFLKGTSLFFCSQSLLLKLCHDLYSKNLQSDDTYLMKEYVKTLPIIIDPKFNSYWSPRQDMTSFLARVRERGPSFVEYHIFEHRGKFFGITMVLIAYFLVLVSFLFVSLSLFTSALLFSLALIAATTAFFTQNPFEFLKLAPLHTATVVSFFLSILSAISKTLLKLKD